MMMPEIIVDQYKTASGDEYVRFAALGPRDETIIKMFGFAGVNFEDHRLVAKVGCPILKIKFGQPTFLI